LKPGDVVMLQPEKDVRMNWPADGDSELKVHEAQVSVLIGLAASTAQSVLPLTPAPFAPRGAGATSNSTASDLSLQGVETGELTEVCPPWPPPNPASRQRACTVGAQRVAHLMLLGL
jgi:hypothetical protein